MNYMHVATRCSIEQRPVLSRAVHHQHLLCQLTGQHDVCGWTMLYQSFVRTPLLPLLENFLLSAVVQS